MNPFFSIIIPCCNVGKYIRECLESIIEQSFIQFECLCIIEDSSDDTETIVREFAANDPRFRVFTQPRSGSAALPRTIGIDNANGEYIIFCDGDDSLADNSLTILADHIAEHPKADIYACAIYEYQDGGGFIRPIDNFLPDAPTELSGHDAVLLLYNYWRNPSPMVQENLWRRGFLNAHNLRFVSGLQHDDHEVFPRALYLAERIVPLHEPFYLYRRQNTSITLSNRQPGHFMKHMAIVLKSLFAFYALESAKPGFNQRIGFCWAREWVEWVLEYWFYDYKRIPREKRLVSLKELFADGFNSFEKLPHLLPFPKRVAAWWVCFFVRYPSLSWLAELFFRCYFTLADFKKKGENKHLHGENCFQLNDQ